MGDEERHDDPRATATQPGVRLRVLEGTATIHSGTNAGSKIVGEVPADSDIQLAQSTTATGQLWFQAVSPSGTTGYAFGEIVSSDGCQVGFIPHVPALAGIGGWLALPALGLVLTLLFGAIFVAASIVAVAQLIVSGGLRALTADPSLGEMALLTLYFVFTGGVAYAFFKHRSFVPPLMIVWLLTGVGVPLALGRMGPPEAVVVLPWVLYFLVSKRVRNTFSRRSPTRGSS